MNVHVEVARGTVEWLAHVGASVPRIFAEATRRVLIAYSQEIGAQVVVGGVLTPHSGSLGRSWIARFGQNAEVAKLSAGAVGSLASNHPAAAIHEHGGTIKPVKANMLAIPLDAAKTPSGIARWSSPLEVPGLFAIKSKAGNVLLVRRTVEKVKFHVDTLRGAGGRYRRKGLKTVTAEQDAIEPLFVLKAQVEMPARKYLTLARTETEGHVEPIFSAVIDAEIARRVA